MDAAEPLPVGGLVGVTRAHYPGPRRSHAVTTR
jgi:hypothetical protein